MAKILGVIPARLLSTRLPRKLLADVAGRPLIWHTIQQAKKAKMLDEIVVATDAEEIAQVAVGAGVAAIMTSTKHRSGSDRVAEAVRRFKDFRPDIVINVQGDEPIVSPSAIDTVARLLVADRKLPMATVASPFDESDDVEKTNLVKVVLARNGDALYFSRSIIPHPRNPHERFLKHIGIFGFRRDFLLEYVRMKQTPLELAESLEQLRVLENGYRIRVGIGRFRHHSVDVPEDLAYVQAYFQRS